MMTYVATASSPRATATTFSDRPQPSARASNDLDRPPGLSMPPGGTVYGSKIALVPATNARLHSQACKLPQP
eukprot:6992518-Prymnesium_polylepis.2